MVVGVCAHVCGTGGGVLGCGTRHARCGGKRMAHNKGTAGRAEIVDLAPRPKNRLRAAFLGHWLHGDLMRSIRGTTYSRERGCYIEGRPLQPSEAVLMLLVAQKAITEALVAARGDAKAKVVYEYEDFG